MVPCSPAIPHWLLTDLFLVTGYKAWPTLHSICSVGAMRIKQTKLVPRLPVVRCLRP